MAEMPKFVQIEPVGQCNLKCRMCPIQFRTDGSDGPPAFIAYEDYTRLILEFPELEELHLQGLGEPLMHPRFFEMVRFAADRGVRVSTNSNLTLFTRRRAALCVTSGLDTMHVSLDGATAEIYERIRVNSNFDRVVANIRLLQAVKAAMESETPALRLVLVLMRQNLHELPALVTLAAGIGVKEIFVQHLCHDFQESTLPRHYAPMRDFVDAESLLGEDTERVERHFAEARAEAERTGTNLRLPTPNLANPHNERTSGRDRCDWPWRGMYFSYDGQAMPCCMISTPDRFNFGDAAAEGAEAIWNGERYEEFRRGLDAGEPPEICRSCAVYRGIF